MPEINPIGPLNPPKETVNIQKIEKANASFEDIVKEVDGIAFRPLVKDLNEKINPLDKISRDLIPDEKSERAVVGYQRTFLGTFSKGTKAEITRGVGMITVKSPLGNMKIEMQDKELVYVEIPQGSFIGKLNANENGGIIIESDDKKKSINIEPQANGEVKVTNKGIDASVYIVFKPMK